MNCFIHHENPAIGICSVCGRGVCQQCAIDTGTFLSLVDRPECAEKIKSIREISDRATKSQTTIEEVKARTQQVLQRNRNFFSQMAAESYRRAISWACLGSIGLLYGVLKFGTLVSYIIIAACGLLLFDAFNVYKQSQIFKNHSGEPTTNQTSI